MDTFVRQYGDKPIVVECGFHTLEYNGGERPNQTAGLVQDLAAKRRAVRAMAEFYGANYPQVRGILYFGYNLYKEEGTPPTVLDWALQYPSRELVQAEDAGRSGQAEVIEDAVAEGGMAVRLSGAQSGLSFSKCLAAQQLALRYKAEQPVLVGLYVGGKLKRTAELPASADYTERGILISVVEGYDLDLRLEGEGNLEIDWVRMLEAMEAEYAELCGTARAQSGENARNGAYVTGISGPENAVEYRGSRGGEVLSVTYRSGGGAKLVMLAGQEKYSVELPAAQQFTALPISAALAAGADFSLYTEDGEIELDAVQLSGAPLPAAAGQQEPEAPAGSPRKSRAARPGDGSGRERRRRWRLRRSDADKTEKERAKSNEQPALQDLPQAGAEHPEAVEELLAQMTLEEKLGQMSQSVGADITAVGSTRVHEPVEELIRKGRLGSMIQVGEPGELAGRVRRFQTLAVQESRLGIPLLFCQDVIHGFETVFPIPLAWSCSFDEQRIRAAAHTAAQEAACCGIMCAYSPMVDIPHDPAGAGRRKQRARTRGGARR